jgi:hypothetical protein
MSLPPCPVIDPEHARSCNGGRLHPMPQRAQKSRSARQKSEPVCQSRSGTATQGKRQPGSGPGILASSAGAKLARATSVLRPEAPVGKNHQCAPEPTLRSKLQPTPPQLPRRGFGAKIALKLFAIYLSKLPATCPARHLPTSEIIKLSFRTLVRFPPPPAK